MLLLSRQTCPSCTVRPSDPYPRRYSAPPASHMMCTRSPGTRAHLDWAARRGTLRLRTRRSGPRTRKTGAPPALGLARQAHTDSRSNRSHGSLLQPHRRFSPTPPEPPPTRADMSNGKQATLGKRTPKMTGFGAAKMGIWRPSLTLLNFPY